MKNAKEAIVGILGVTPLLGSALILVASVLDVDGKSHPDLFVALMWVFAIFVFPLPGVWLIVILEAIRNPRLPVTAKVLWIFSTTILSIVAIPLYWYLEIWRRRGMATPGSSIEGGR